MTVELDVWLLVEGEVEQLKMPEEEQRKKVRAVRAYGLGWCTTRGAVRDPAKKFGTVRAKVGPGPGQCPRGGPNVFSKFPGLGTSAVHIRPLSAFKSQSAASALAGLWTTRRTNMRTVWR